LCDEGRYGFDRFLPKVRVTSAYEKGEAKSLEEALKKTSELKKGNCLILVAPDLTVEEFAIVESFNEKCLENSKVVTALRSRTLSDLEKILVSPDYAANFRGGVFAKGEKEGTREQLEQRYEEALRQLKGNVYDSVIFVGDRAIAEQDFSDMELLQAINRMPFSLGILCDREGPLFDNCSVVLPGRSILEKSGLLINKDDRVQYAQQATPILEGTLPHWRAVGLVAQHLGKSIVEARADRDLTLSYLQAEPRLAGLTIRDVKQGGVDLKTYTPKAHGEASSKQSNEAEGRDSRA
ncbi:MAG: hypothetical protein KDD70_13260, partial [Bdellovibrionales bacterium]|nr:hypothetical protein [Bdellovibrionales bacterium]